MNRTREDESMLGRRSIFDFIKRLLAPGPNQPFKPMRFVKIVGESHYQESLSAIAGGKTRDGHLLHVQARVIPEHDNPAHPMAVRVEVQGQTVGYLTRRQAVQFRKRSRAAVDCGAKIVGGWDRGHGDTGHLGVRLDLTL
jgi:hypothetical protein